jgi:hypothetical protein
MRLHKNQTCGVSAIVLYFSRNAMIEGLIDIIIPDHSTPGAHRPDDLLSPTVSAKPTIYRISTYAMPAFS